MFIVLFIVTFLTSLALFAAEAIKEPTSFEEISQLIPMFFQFASEGKWLMFGSLATLVIVFALKKYFIPKLSNNALPWVSLGVGVLSAFAITLLTGASPKEAALALMSGPTASMLWTLIAKHIFKVEVKSA